MSSSAIEPSMGAEGMSLDVYYATVADEKIISGLDKDAVGYIVDPVGINKVPSDVIVAAVVVDVHKSMRVVPSKVLNNIVANAKQSKDRVTELECVVATKQESIEVLERRFEAMRNTSATSSSSNSAVSTEPLMTNLERWAQAEILNAEMLDEINYLKKTIEEQRQTINDQGKAIEEQRQTMGKAIEEQRQTINDQGKAIEEQRQTINDQGKAIARLQETVDVLMLELRSLQKK